MCWWFSSLVSFFWFLQTCVFVCFLNGFWYGEGQNQGDKGGFKGSIF